MNSFLRKLLIISVMVSNGQSNWLTDAGGNANDEALDLAMDDQGNFLTTGYFSYASLFGNQHLISSGSGDIFITRQDPDGNHLWSVRAGGYGSDRGNSITTDPAGNIYVAGFFTDMAQFGTFSLVSDGLQDVFAAKLNSSGNFIWVKQLGGTGNEIALGIATDLSGSITIAGQFSDSGVFDGFTMISETNPVTGDDRAMNVAAGGNGSVYVCGQYSDTITFGSTYTIPFQEKETFQLSDDEENNLYSGCMCSDELRSSTGYTHQSGAQFRKRK